jgi:hypothetical protein
MFSVATYRYFELKIFKFKGYIGNILPLLAVKFFVAIGIDCV